MIIFFQCACKLEWFSDQETDDLLKLAKEVSWKLCVLFIGRNELQWYDMHLILVLVNNQAMKSFSDPEYILIEPAHASYWVSAVMSRSSHHPLLCATTKEFCNLSEMSSQAVLTILCFQHIPYAWEKLPRMSFQQLISASY